MTNPERRILRTAHACDAAIFNGKQRHAIERLHALGRIERQVKFVAGRSKRHGHHEITVAITQALCRLFWPTVR